MSRLAVCCMGTAATARFRARANDAPAYLRTQYAQLTHHYIPFTSSSTLLQLTLEIRGLVTGEESNTDNLYNIRME